MVDRRAVPAAISWGAAALAPAPRHLGGQRLESRHPHPPEPAEPCVELAQRLAFHGVEASGAVGAHRGEAAVAQHLQVLRHRRLGDAELALDHLDDAARRRFAVGEQLEDAPAHRVAQDVEGVHVAAGGRRRAGVERGGAPGRGARRIGRGAGRD